MPGRSGPRTWIDQQQELADALATGQIAPLDWCREVETLSRQVDLAELLATARLAADDVAKPGGPNDPQKRVVHFSDVSGRQQRLSYNAALIAFQPGNVLTPRTRRSGVSAHLVLDGALRIRSYDKVRDDRNGMMIRPAGDVIVGVGKVSTMCAERRPVHWLVPKGGPATVLEVSIGGNAEEVMPLDPLGGKILKDGSILAPMIGQDAAALKYTSDL